MSEDRCVCCGDIIPEGRQVCKICESNFKKPNEKILSELQSLKKDFGDCNSTEEVRLIRKWNKAVNACIDVVEKYV